MGQIQSFDEFLDLLRRRFLLIVTVALAGMVMVAVVLKSRPDTFEAAAVLQIETPMVAGADGALAASGAAQMLQTIEQRLTTRENLLAVIERHGLYAELAAIPPDEKVNLLRRSLRFQTVASATGTPFGGPPPISALLVIAQMDQADHAARVANDFAQSILDLSSAGQLERARETTEFFKGEEARVWGEITPLEAEIAAYQSANVAALPAGREALGEESQALEADLRQLEQDRVALDGQRAALRTSGLQRATEQRALSDVEARLSVLDAQQAALLARRAEIDAVLAQGLEVQRQLSAYERQLQQLQGQYEVINRRMAEAETAQRLAERQQAERFTLLERAVTPQYPTGASRMKQMIAGAVASVLGAITLAFVLDLLNPVVRTAAQMERQLDLRPVVSIPEVRAAARSRQRRKTLLQLVDDPRRPILGLPRYAVVAGGATLCLVLAAAAIS